MNLFVKAKPTSCCHCVLWREKCFFGASYNDCPLIVLHEGAVLGGMCERAQTGKWCGGRPPYGYYLKNGKLYIDRFNAGTVRYIFSSFAKGVSIYQLVIELNKVLFKPSPSGGKWSYATVERILKNRKYAGTAVFNERRRISGAYKRENEVIKHEKAFAELVDKKTFQAVQARLKALEGKGTE